MSKDQWSLPLGLLGASLGGVLGVFAFDWIAGQGFYAIMLPGLFCGLGCGCLSWRESNAKGIGCAIIALGASLIAEWWAFPFLKDKSLLYFLGNLQTLRPITLILMGLGIGLAYYLGRGTFRHPGPSRSNSSIA